MRKFLAFDIGGTKIAYALVDEQGTMLTQSKKYSTPKTVEEIVQSLRDIIKLYEQEIEAVAIATAGAVDVNNQRIVSSVGNMAKGYQNTNFQELSSKPVYIENDANAVAWAEYKQGVAKDCKDIIVVAIGTGLGLGILVDGKILKGKSGAAAEAHFQINRGKKRKCSCGAYDCYEAYSSGTALGIDAKEAFNDNTLTSHDVIRLVNEKNPQAIEVFDMWQEDVLAGIKGLVNLFDSEMVILFGSLVKFMDCEKLETKANEDIVAAPFKLKKAHFGDDAAMIGISLIAAEKVLKWFCQYY